MQRLILNDARDPDVKPSERAQIARAYCDLEETKRRLRMKPLPKSVDTTKLAKSKRATQHQSALIDQPDKESLSEPPTVTAPPPREGAEGANGSESPPPSDTGHTP